MQPAVAAPLSRPAPLATSGRAISENDVHRLRRVFYLPGFDPREPEAYWGLFRRESGLTARRRGMSIDVGRPVRSSDDVSLDWTIVSTVGSDSVRTLYGLLRWDDIVRSRFPRSNLARLRAIPALWWRLSRNGYVRAFRREAWQFSTVIFVVHLLYAGLVCASLLMAWLLLDAPPLAEMHPLLRAALVAPSAYAILGLLTLTTKGRPLFIAHLVDDTAFTHEHASGTDGDMRARLEAWAERIRAAERDSSEIVVVGHSSGSFLALEALERVLTRDPDFARRGTPVTLVTLGGLIPWIGLDPRAEATRGALRCIADASAIGWLDLRAPWDWLSIHRRGPLAALDLDSIAMDRPRVQSVAIEDLIERSTVVYQRWDFFRMHFQLLMSSRDRQAFDYIALTAGPEPVHRAVAAPRAAVQASPVPVKTQ